MKKRVFVFLFALAFLLVEVLPAAAAVAPYQPLVFLVGDGTYMIVGKDASGKEYALNGNGGAVARPKIPDESLQWEVVEKKNAYTFRSVSSELYLTLTANGVKMSDKAQSLTVTPDDVGSGFLSGKSGGTFYLCVKNGAFATANAKDDSCRLLFCAEEVPEYDNGDNEPIYRVACFSDLHIDYNLQNQNPPIRPATIKAVEALKDLGGADVMIVGGDTVSGNDKGGRWSKDIYKKTADTIYETLSDGVDGGEVLFITGNHDSEPGVYANNAFYSGDMDAYMTDNAGEFVDAFYFDDLENPVENSKWNELLCYRYTNENMEIIGINTPYRSTRTGGYVYAEQIAWVNDQMKEIGRDKTVILFSHYPLSSVTSPTGDKGGDANSKLKSLLGMYPNILYFYGHIHDGDDMVWYHTMEQVEPAGNVTLLENGAYESNRYITCFMGSMGYYDTHYQPGGLTAQDPMVVQFLLVDFYADHITFQYYNVGETNCDPDVKEIASFTVMRDMWQLTGGSPSDKTDSSDNTDSSASATDSGIASTEPAGTGSNNNLVIVIVLVACGVIVLGGVAVLIVFLMKNKKGAK